MRKPRKDGWDCRENAGLRFRRCPRAGASRPSLCPARASCLGAGARDPRLWRRGGGGPEPRPPRPSSPRPGTCQPAGDGEAETAAPPRRQPQVDTCRGRRRAVTPASRGPLSRPGRAGLPRGHGAAGARGVAASARRARLWSHNDHLSSPAPSSGPKRPSRPWGAFPCDARRGGGAAGCGGRC